MNDYRYTKVTKDNSQLIRVVNNVASDIRGEMLVNGYQSYSHYIETATREKKLIDRALSAWKLTHADLVELLEAKGFAEIDELPSATERLPKSLEKFGVMKK